MPDSTRRRFLADGGRATALAASAFSGVHAWADANSRNTNAITLGLIGCGGMMGGHAQGMVDRRSNVAFAWLCDVDPRRLDALTEIVSPHQSAPPARTSRYEDVLDDAGVDAVLIATPHHWHAPIALAALDAGKDVYIEKPISHVFDEGPRIVAAADRLGRVVQHGSQMRSSPVTKQAAKLLADGIIGEVKVARAWTAELRNPQPAVPDSAPPTGVDYDRWLGPAPVRPFNRHRFHGTWRMFRDYGNGEIGDDGIHDLDMARWGLGDPAMPARVTARSGRLLPGESYTEYPDNMHVVYEYDDGRTLVYENYPFTEYGLHGFDNGNVFYGTEGYMVFSRRGAFSTFLGPKGKRGPTEEKSTRGAKGYDEHMEEFLTAVRDRTPTSSSAPTAHASCALVHLGEITSRTTGRLEFDADANRFKDCDAANELLTKPYRAPFALGSA